MLFGGNVFQRVRQEAQREQRQGGRGEGQGGDGERAKGGWAGPGGGARWAGGELLWVTETDTPARDKSRALRVARGEKHPLTAEESVRFADSAYERGFKVYIYQGEFKTAKSLKESTDPRGAVRQGHGTLFYPNGEVFEGNWLHDRRHGVGCLSSKKGYSYTGDWCDDVANGSGREVFSSQAAIDATYVNSLPEGDGVMRYNSKASDYRYEGKWHEGLRHGNGVIFYNNGDTFEGNFFYGKRHGRGVTTQTINGREIQYETQWRNDQLVGAPKTIPHALRTKKPVSTLCLRK